jgi:hypothetical protein
VKSALFACDGAVPGRRWAKEEWPARHELNSSVGGNMRLHLTELSTAIHVPLNSAVLDLVTIASYCYAADQSIRRGGEADIYGDDWSRRLGLAIPVFQPDLWSSEPVLSGLATLLQYMTEDRWEFEFVSKKQDVQGMIPLPRKSAADRIDSVALVSGGADSLCSVIDAIRSENLRLAITSHISPGPVSARQRELVTELRGRTGETLPHVSCYISRSKTDAPEPSPRSRAFLHASLGVATALGMGAVEVRLSDNGVVSLNLPINAQLVGARASRTTHPRTLWLLNRLITTALGSESPRVTNPLAFLTRAETLDLLVGTEFRSLVAKTISCSRTRNLPAHRPHCGVCTQCVSRRFATEAAGFQAEDPADGYQVDILRDELTEENNARTVVLGFVRFATRIASFQDLDLFEAFPELTDAVLDDDTQPDRTINRYIAMLRRHSASVTGVAEAKLREAAPALVAGQVAAGSLLAALPSVPPEGPSLAAGTTPAAPAVIDFSASDDYRSIRWRGRDYALTTNQAIVIQELHESWVAHRPYVAQVKLLDLLGTPNGRLRDSFRRSPLWGDDALIISPRRGIFCLNLPSAREVPG